jgi:hypothetical protein
MRVLTYVREWLPCFGFKGEGLQLLYWWALSGICLERRIQSHSSGIRYSVRFDTSPRTVIFWAVLIRPSTSPGQAGQCPGRDPSFVACRCCAQSAESENSRQPPLPRSLSLAGRGRRLAKRISRITSTPSSAPIGGFQAYCCDQRYQ